MPCCAFNLLANLSAALHLVLSSVSDMLRSLDNYNAYTRLEIHYQPHGLLANEVNEFVILRTHPLGL